MASIARRSRKYRFVDIGHQFPLKKEKLSFAGSKIIEEANLATFRGAGMIKPEPLNNFCPKMQPALTSFPGVNFRHDSGRPVVTPNGQGVCRR
jgi:hypothetical protein